MTTDVVDATRGTLSPRTAGAEPVRLWATSDFLVAILALTGIAVHLVLKYWLGVAGAADLPLLIVLLAGGSPLVLRLLWQATHGQFGSDQLAGVSIVASALLGEYLAGVVVVLMLSGGKTLEQFAVARATAVLRALATRAPTLAHRKRGTEYEDVPVGDVRVNDELSIRPHEVCPVDGEVLEGHGAMDESYLTGEPYTVPKGPGARVLSGAVNGDSALGIRATRVAADSRYARIMQVMQEAEQRRPMLRRIGDRLGAWYTP
jgi:cation transport ATPase